MFSFDVVCGVLFDAVGNVGACSTLHLRHVHTADQADHAADRLSDCPAAVRVPRQVPAFFMCGVGVAGRLLLLIRVCLPICLL